MNASGRHKVQMRDAFIGWTMGHDLHMTFLTTSCSSPHSATTWPTTHHPSEDNESKRAVTAQYVSGGSCCPGAVRDLRQTNSTTPRARSTKLFSCRKLGAEMFSVSCWSLLVNVCIVRRMLTPTGGCERLSPPGQQVHVALTWS